MFGKKCNLRETILLFTKARKSMFSKQFYKLHIIKVWAYIWYFCTCFKCYNTVISDTYVPPWESRAIAVYGRKYVVQRNRILSTAFYLKKLLNGTPITEMHSRRERGQNIRDQIAEIVKAKIWLVYTSMTLCKNRFRWFFLNWS